MQFTLVKQTGNSIEYIHMPVTDMFLNKIKLNYLDFGNIVKKPKRTFKDIKELKGKDLSKIYYKSGCLTVFQNDIYTSSVFSDGNDPVLTVRNLPPAPVIDDPDFWDQSDSYLLLEKIA